MYAVLCGYRRYETLEEARAAAEQEAGTVRLEVGVFELVETVSAVVSEVNIERKNAAGEVLESRVSRPAEIADVVVDDTP